MIKHFYRVDQFVTTFEADPGKNESFSHSEIFTPDNIESVDSLIEARNRAMEFYNKVSAGPPSGRYFLPLASPQDFKMGEASAFSCNLIFVYVSGDGEEEEFILHGESDDVVSEAQENERQILADLIRESAGI